MHGEIVKKESCSAREPVFCKTPILANSKKTGYEPLYKTEAERSVCLNPKKNKRKFSLRRETIVIRISRVLHVF